MRELEDGGIERNGERRAMKREAEDDKQTERSGEKVELYKEKNEWKYENLIKKREEKKEIKVGRGVALR